MAKGKRSERGIVIIDGVEYEAKTCTICRVMKRLDDYGVQGNTKDKRKSRCKPCLAEINRKYSKENPDKRRQAERSWRECNPEKVKEMAKDSRIRHKDGYKRRLDKWKAENPERDRALKSASSQKRRALDRLLPVDFDASDSQFIRVLYDGCAFTDNKDDLHDDHFIALATGHGGSYFANMVPLSSGLNLSKNKSNPFEWLDTVEGINFKKAAKSILMLCYLNRVTFADYVEFVYWCYDNPREPEDITDENRDSLSYWLKINSKSRLA